MRILLAILVVMLILGSGVFLYARFLQKESKKPLIFPFSSETPRSLQEPPKPTHIVYGFLPYWNIKTAQIDPTLTHIAYFSVRLDGTGNLMTRDGKAAELGYHTLQSAAWNQLVEKTQGQQQKLELVVAMMNQDDIETFLRDTTVQQHAIQTITLLEQNYPIQGINIDIEYNGTDNATLRQAYTTFISNLRKSLKTHDKNMSLSIDVYADSLEKTRIWDIAALNQYVDHIIVMTYDFYRSSSQSSGPVSPLFGSGNGRWTLDVMKSMKKFIDIVPPEKILLGIPFYGYEWRTVSEDPGSQTYPNTGGLATYKRVQQLVDKYGLQTQWDADALSPYISYTIGNITKTAYFEDARSLSYKLQLVNEAHLGGIAIWALGYEGESRELWQVIRNML